MSTGVCLGGLSFFASSDSEQAVGRISDKCFNLFKRHPPDAPLAEPVEIRIRNAAAPAPDSKRVSQGILWPGTAYECGNDRFVLRTADSTENGFDWITAYRTDDETCEAYVRPHAESDKCWRFPELDRYPHLRCVLAWKLARRQGLWLHASAALRNGRMFILTGRSGRGKSTLSSLLHASGKFEIASDEKNVVRLHNGAFYAYGTPWTSSARLCANLAAPLAGIFFLDHAADNAIVPLTKSQAMRTLLPQIHVPWFDKRMAESILATADILLNTAPCQRLAFRPDAAVAELLAKHTDGLPPCRAN